jgi:hypothetical protein
VVDTRFVQLDENKPSFFSTRALFSSLKLIFVGGFRVSRRLIQDMYSGAMGGGGGGRWLTRFAFLGGGWVVADGGGRGARRGCLRTQRGLRHANPRSQITHHRPTSHKRPLFAFWLGCVWRSAQRASPLCCAVRSRSVAGTRPAAAPAVFLTNF